MSVDDVIHEVITFIEDEGLANNTYFLYSSDHVGILYCLAQHCTALHCLALLCLALLCLALSCAVVRKVAQPRLAPLTAA